MNGERKRYGPEGLRVYDLALQFAARLDELLSEARCSASLRDQLTRAAESVVLNIAEGAGHVMPGRKAYHYGIARASVNECIGGLPILQLRNPGINFIPLRRMGDMQCTMLTALIRRYQS